MSSTTSRHVALLLSMLFVCLALAGCQLLNEGALLSAESGESDYSDVVTDEDDERDAFEPFGGIRLRPSVDIVETMWLSLH